MDLRFINKLHVHYLSNRSAVFVTENTFPKFVDSLIDLIKLIFKTV